MTLTLKNSLGYIENPQAPLATLNIIESEIYPRMFREKTTSDDYDSNFRFLKLFAHNKEYTSRLITDFDFSKLRGGAEELIIEILRNSKENNSYCILNSLIFAQLTQRMMETLITIKPIVLKKLNIMNYSSFRWRGVFRINSLEELHGLTLENLDGMYMPNLTSFSVKINDYSVTFDFSNFPVLEYLKISSSAHGIGDASFLNETDRKKETERNLNKKFPLVAENFGTYVPRLKTLDLDIWSENIKVENSDFEYLENLICRGSSILKLFQGKLDHLQKIETLGSLKPRLDETLGIESIIEIAKNLTVINAKWDPWPTSGPEIYLEKLKILSCIGKKNNDYTNFPNLESLTINNAYNDKPIKVYKKLRYLSVSFMEQVEIFPKVDNNPLGVLADRIFFARGNSRLPLDIDCSCFTEEIELNFEECPEKITIRNQNDKKILIRVTNFPQIVFVGPHNPQNVTLYFDTFPRNFRKGSDEPRCGLSGVLISIAGYDYYINDDGEVIFPEGDDDPFLIDENYFPGRGDRLIKNSVRPRELQWGTRKVRDRQELKIPREIYSLKNFSNVLNVDFIMCHFNDSASDTLANFLKGPRKSVTFTECTGNCNIENINAKKFSIIRCKDFVNKINLELRSMDILELIDFFVKKPNESSIKLVGSVRHLMVENLNFKTFWDLNNMSGDMHDFNDTNCNVKIDIYGEKLEVKETPKKYIVRENYGMYLRVECTNVKNKEIKIIQ